MDSKWTLVLVILVFYQEKVQGAVEEQMVKEGSPVEIKCTPAQGTLVIWLRFLDQSGVEFIGSFSPYGVSKKEGKDYTQNFSHRIVGDQHILILKSYKPGDSGLYTCCALHNNQLLFGSTTRLRTPVEEVRKEKIPAPTPLCTTWPTERTTTKQCVCPEKIGPGRSDLYRICSPIILGPLAGGCGFLLLLLIIISLYCNKIRTRRCPHHYKRKPRMRNPDKMMTNI